MRRLKRRRAEVASNELRHTKEKVEMEKQSKEELCNQNRSQSCVHNWSDALTTGTLVSGAGLLYFNPAPLVFPIMAFMCCSLGAIALDRSIVERKWSRAVLSALVIALVVYSAFDASCVSVMLKGE